MLCLVLDFQGVNGNYRSILLQYLLLRFNIKLTCQASGADAAGALRRESVVRVRRARWSPAAALPQRGAADPGWREKKPS